MFCMFVAYWISRGLSTDNNKLLSHLHFVWENMQEEKSNCWGRRQYDVPRLSAISARTTSITSLHRHGRGLILGLDVATEPLSLNLPTNGRNVFRVIVQIVLEWRFNAAILFVNLTSECYSRYSSLISVTTRWGTLYTRCGRKVMRLIFYLPSTWIFFKHQCYSLQSSSLGHLQTDGGVVPTVGSSAWRLQSVWSSVCPLHSFACCLKFHWGHFLV